MTFTVNILNLKKILFLFSNSMVIIRTGNYKMLLRIVNRVDPDQTASSEEV